MLTPHWERDSSNSRICREIKMKQKFEIQGQGDKLVIKEYAELDKEMMSLLCEESYERSVIGEAVSRGTEATMAAIRTKNMYPPTAYAEKLGTAIAEMFDSSSEGPVEVVINDLELLASSIADQEDEADELEDETDIDDLLEDDVDTDEDNLEDEIAVKKIKSSLKVADDEAADLDDDI
jgi:hypothetical protein